MCQEKDYIQFCTCEVSDSGNLIESNLDTFDEIAPKYLDTFYKWRLYRIDGKRDPNVMSFGEIIRRPDNHLNEWFTARYMVDALNSDANFDFNYLPKDGDELIIQESYIYSNIRNKPRPWLKKTMKFVFENNEWYFGFIENEELVQKNIESGKININKKE